MTSHPCERAATPHRPPSAGAGPDASGPLTGWTERTVVRDGVRLVARDHGGAGRPVLLLHGLAGRCGEWDATAARMREWYRVVALDQRGHGASERGPGDMSRSAYVADAIAVITRCASTGSSWWVSPSAGTPRCSRLPRAPISYGRW